MQLRRGDADMYCGTTTAFDRDIDLKKKELRLERWRQILRFQRKPNKLQRQILYEDMVQTWVIIGIIAVVAYALY